MPSNHHNNQESKTLLPGQMIQPTTTNYDATNSPAASIRSTRSVPKSPLLVRTLSALSSRSPEHSLVGIILITLGSFSFSCMFLFVKLMQGKANSFTVAFYRALVEIPIAIGLIVFGPEEEYEDDDGYEHEHDEEISRQQVPVSNNAINQKNTQPQQHQLQPSLSTPLTVADFLGSPHVRGWLLVRGGMGGAAVLCFFYAIQHLSLPDAVTLQFTTPPFAAAFAVCLAGETWLLLDMMGAVVCLLGVMLIAHPTWLFGDTTTTAGDADEQQQQPDNMGAVAVALLGAAFAGMAYMSVRKIGHHATANIMVLYYSCLSLPVTILGSKLLLGTCNVWAGGSYLTGWDWFFILWTGITAYLGQYLTNLGLQYETAATGTLATCTQIVFTYGFELAFLHEPINVWSIAGTLLILGFMVIVGVMKMSVADETIHERVAGEPEELALLFSAERHTRRGR